MMHQHQHQRHHHNMTIDRDGMAMNANSGKQKSGSFILLNDHRTYLIHCDISQHMEQGLKAQLAVGDDDGNSSSTPGIRGGIRPDRYGQ